MFRAEISSGASGTSGAARTAGAGMSTVSRAGDVLSASVDTSCCASRFGSFTVFVVVVFAWSSAGDFEALFTEVLPAGVMDGFVTLLDRPLKLSVGCEDLCALFVPCLLGGIIGVL